MSTTLKVARGSVITKRARQINKTLGARAAAGFLRNRDISLRVALYVVAGRIS